MQFSFSRFSNDTVILRLANTSAYGTRLTLPFDIECIFYLGNITA